MSVAYASNRKFACFLDGYKVIYSIDSGEEPSDTDVVVKWKRMSIQVVSTFVIFFLKTSSHELRIILGVL